MSQEKRALPLIRQIYASALEPEGWNDFVAQLSAEFGGSAVALSLQVPTQGRPLAIHRVGFVEGFQSVFAKHVARGLPWGDLRTLDPTGYFARANEFFPDDKLPDTDFYREYMEPQGFAAEGPVVSMINPAEGMLFSGLAIYRKKDGRQFTDEDLRLGDLLVPHLEQAFNIHCRVGGINRARLALGEVIDRLPTGVILLDSQRRPVVTNLAADQIIEQRDGFYLSDTGPRASIQRDDVVLQGKIDQVVKNDTDGQTGGFMALTRPSGRRPFAVMLTSVPKGSPESTVTDAAAMLFVSDPDSGSPSTVEMLRNIYGLTNAEAELVQLLVSGHSLDEVSGLRGVTMNTVRSQLKHVFAKTDTKRQGDLVRLIITGVASLRES